MYFTREPIIETIITAREGHRLTVRPVSSAGQEEFSVDMVEIISFGNACFFRSLDKPKPFMLPVTDYELVESREQRVGLKAPATVQKGIKIGGGNKESKKEEPEEGESKSTRRNKRGRKRESERVEAPMEEKNQEIELVSQESINNTFDKPMLIPPPPMLISETISRYKEMSAIEELALEPIVQEIDEDQGE